jgi:hypothetical protein
MKTIDWILTVYLLVLIYLALKRDKFEHNAPLRPAWITFALIPVSHFVFALFRAGNFPAPRDLALIEIWADGIAWLLLGASLLFLTGMIAPEPPSYADRSKKMPSPTP